MIYTEYKSLTINGTRLVDSEIVEFCHDSKIENVRRLGQFMSEWLDENSDIEVKTSGSTGTPKKINVSKSKMLQSASMTAKYFGFQPGQTALLCLPMVYIAAKMMAVRALYSGLNLYCIEPDSRPLISIPIEEDIFFAPLTPMQLSDGLVPSHVKKILLGGAPLQYEQERRLQFVGAEIFHSYGMTETLSHVAVRRVNGPLKSPVYEALPGVRFQTNEDSCLEILVPFIDEVVKTKDVVDLVSETEFLWKGRLDSVVNSGGIKLFPEEIEKKMSSFMSESFFMAGIPDKTLGEKLVLIIESRPFPMQRISAMIDKIEKVLGKYEKPRDIFFFEKFKYTESGKVMRKATLDSLKK